MGQRGLLRVREVYYTKGKTTKRDDLDAVHRENHKGNWDPPSEHRLKTLKIVSAPPNSFQIKS